MWGCEERIRLGARQFEKSRKQGPGVVGSPPKNPIICYNCNRPGHIVAYCPIKEEQMQCNLSEKEDTDILYACPVVTAVLERPRN